MSNVNDFGIGGAPLVACRARRCGFHCGHGRATGEPGRREHVITSG
jgi:hypothetical protein